MPESLVDVEAQIAALTVKRDALTAETRDRAERDRLEAAEANARALKDEFRPFCESATAAACLEAEAYSAMYDLAGKHYRKGATYLKTERGRIDAGNFADVDEDGYRIRKPQALGMIGGTVVELVVAGVRVWPTENP